MGPSGPGATETRVAGRGDHNVEYADEMEGAVSPMQFTREGSDGGHDDIDFDRGWDVASPGTCNHPVVKSREQFLTTISIYYVTDLPLSFYA